MDLTILGTDFSAMGIIDTAKSVIWTRRYFSPGDFEICVSATPKATGLLKIGRYIFRQDNPYVGVIERLEITAEEEGEYITAIGRFSEAILARRIVWKQTQLYGTLENGIRRLIQENVISPTISERKIEEIGLGELYDVTMRLDCQITGDNLLDAITEKCQAAGVGFRNRFTGSGFLFELYEGKDRSVSQNTYPHVIFSDIYDNLLQSNYLVDTSGYANVALVAGEGEGLERRTTVTGAASGLGRYEKFVDEKGMSSNKGEIPEADYIAALAEKGKEKLADITEVFDGIVISDGKYICGVDYEVGDIVTVENSRWGLFIDARIIEIIESEDETGVHLVPSFGK